MRKRRSVQVFWIERLCSHFQQQGMAVFIFLQGIGAGFRTAWESLMVMPKAHPVKRHSLMRKTMNNIHLDE